MNNHPFGFDFLTQQPPTAAQQQVRQMSGGADSPDSGNGGAHAMAKVEQVHVLTHPNLVNANEITIQQPKILEHAQPIALTLAECLKRNDKMIINALIDKHNILSELLKEEKV